MLKYGGRLIQPPFVMLSCSSATSKEGWSRSVMLSLWSNKMLFQSAITLGFVIQALGKGAFLLSWIFPVIKMFWAKFCLELDEVSLKPVGFWPCCCKCLAMCFKSKEGRSPTTVCLQDQGHSSTTKCWIWLFHVLWSMLLSTWHRHRALRGWQGVAAGLTGEDRTLRDSFPKGTLPRGPCLFHNHSTLAQLDLAKT